MLRSASDETIPERITTWTVLDLAWPIMVSMLSHTFMGVTDTLFVGWLGTAPLAGLGIALTLVYTLQAFPIGLTSGLKVAASQRVGAGRHDAALRLTWQGLWLSLILGTFIAALSGYSQPLLSMMTDSQAVIEEGAAFLQIRLLGVPILFTVFSLSALYHGRGETRTPMVATLIGNVVNAALDPLFIFTLDLGIAGAALATLAGLSVNCGWLAFRLRGDLWAADSQIEWRWMKEIGDVGSPLGARFFLDNLSFVLFAAMLSMIGDAHMAAHILSIRIVSVSFLPGYAVAEASSVLVGQAIGARRVDLARIAWKRAMGFASALMAAMGLVFWIFPDLLLSGFGAESEVFALGRDLLRVAAVFQIFDAVAMVGLSSLNGANDTRFTMIVSVGAAWLVKLPVGYLLAVQYQMGAVGAWWGLLAEIVVLAGIVFWRLMGSAWLDRRLKDTEPLATAT
ncbi:MAG: MATE family efflux transporter [Myxococcota bacterium]